MLVEYCCWYHTYSSSHGSASESVLCSGLTVKLIFFFICDNCYSIYVTINLCFQSLRSRISLTSKVAPRHMWEFTCTVIEVNCSRLTSSVLHFRWPKVVNGECIESLRHCIFHLFRKLLDSFGLECHYLSAQGKRL